MNKKIIKIFIILIFCLFLFENCSYGFIKDDSLKEEMKFKTYLKIVEAKDGKYKIQFRREWITNNIYG